jgi:hypothetical protein
MDAAEHRIRCYEATRHGVEAAGRTSAAVVATSPQRQGFIGGGNVGSGGEGVGRMHGKR